MYWVVGMYVDPQTEEVIAEDELLEGPRAELLDVYIREDRESFRIFPKAYGDLTVVEVLNKVAPRVEHPEIDIFMCALAKELGAQLPFDFTHRVLRLPGDEPDWERFTQTLGIPLG